MLNVGDKHSRKVAWLKLAIPSVVAILIGFFIIFLSFDFSGAIQISMPKFDTKKPMIFKVQALTLSYMDSKNNLTNMFLKEAEEIPNENKISVSDIDTKVEFNTNEWIDIKSKNAMIDKGTSEIELQNNVVITDHKGDILTGKNIKVNIKENTAISNDAVDGKSFLGNISATNGFYIKQNEVYIFKGQVKAKIDPKMFAKKQDMPFQNVDIDMENFKIKKENNTDGKIDSDIEKSIGVSDKELEEDVKKIIKVIN
ncbi:MAG: LPS export ABC transporter periplasmic protein LptC [Rickettsiales bacterium]|jgi:LPS export ABC transporter protein LptC|nr:LPS export ABC transporter periplasmic protein LptC [Rickettsiales bacterium]